MYLSKQELIKFEAHISSEYSYLIGRANTDNEPCPFPHINSLVKETSRSVNNEHLVLLIKEAMDNGMHEEYGMSKREFMTRAQMMQIPYFEKNKIPINDVVQQVVQFVHQYRVSHTNYNNDIINCPIGRGIW